MKKYFGKVSIALIGIFALSCMCGCSKDDDKEYEAYYKYFGLEDMMYISSEEYKAAAFFEELGNIMDNNDGHYFTESSLKSQIESVVRRYNNGVISGTFYLKKTTKSKDNGPWTTIASWTMKFASKYTKCDNVATKTLGTE